MAGRKDLDRIARNEALFREMNSKLEQTFADSPASGPLPFLCECADERCTRPLRLTLAEYRQLRARPDRFVVLPGHQLPPPDEVVIDQGDGFLIVEKRGALVELLDGQQQEA